MSRFFDQISLRFILISFAAAIVLIQVVNFGLVFYAVTQSGNKLDMLIQESEELAEIANIFSDMGAIDRDLRDALLLEDPAAVKEKVDIVKKEMAHLEHEVEKLVSLAVTAQQGDSTAKGADIAYSFTY